MPQTPQNPPEVPYPRAQTVAIMLIPTGLGVTVMVLGAGQTRTVWIEVIAAVLFGLGVLALPTRGSPASSRRTTRRGRTTVLTVVCALAVGIGTSAPLRYQLVLLGLVEGFVAGLIVRGWRNGELAARLHGDDDRWTR